MNRTRWIGLGLFAECRFNNPCASRTKPLGISESDILGISRRVLVNCQEGRDTAALGKHPSHQMARTLGGDHKDIVVGRGDNLSVMDIETVCEGHRVARGQPREDFLAEYPSLDFVIDEHHYDIRGTGSIGYRHHFQTLVCR